MTTAHIHQSGNTLVIEMSEPCPIPAQEVEIRLEGKALAPPPAKRSWQTLIYSPQEFSGDLMENGREQPAFHETILGGEDQTGNRVIHAQDSEDSP